MSRNKDPAVLLYTSDFLSGVTDLTMAERGQYITLLCLQHQKGRLSAKSIELAVGDVSDDVMSRFVRDEEGLFFNARMEEEIISRKRYSESRRNNVMRRYQHNCNENHNETTCVQQKEYICTTKRVHMQVHMENENINKNIINTSVLNSDKNNRDVDQFVTPTVDEVATYCKERCNNIDPQYFVDFYTANGWTQSRGKPIQDWRAAVRCWERNEVSKEKKREAINSSEKPRHGNFDPSEAMRLAVERGQKTEREDNTE